MSFEVSEKIQVRNAKLEAFMREYIYAREHDWQVFGGMGVCQDTLIPDVFTHARFTQPGERVRRRVQ